MWWIQKKIIRPLCDTLQVQSSTAPTKVCMAVPCGLLYGLKFYSDLLCEIRHFLHF